MADPIQTAPTDALIERLRGLLAAKSRTPWLIHSEPDVNYPPTIHSTHPLGNVGDPVEPFDRDDQLLIVEAINALPALLARIEAAEKLGEAVRAFLAKYDECEPSLTSMAVFQQMHLGPYNGPSFGEELAALRAAAQWQAGQEGEG